jgi:hypothetical protein
MDALSLEIQNLRCEIKDAAILEVQLNTVREECDVMKRQRDAFMLESESRAWDIEAIEKRLKEAQSRASWFYRWRTVRT